MDQFICGWCSLQYDVLDEFIKHKKSCSANNQPSEPVQNNSKNEGNEDESINEISMSPDNSPNPSKIIDAKMELNKALARKENNINKPKKRSPPKDVGIMFKKKRRLESPVIAQDGRLQCPRCKRCFTKERSYTKHFCETKMSEKNLYEMEVGIKPLEFEDAEEDEIYNNIAVTEEQMDEPNLKEYFYRESEEEEGETTEIGGEKKKRRTFGPRSNRGPKGSLTTSEIDNLQETLSPIKPAFTSESQRRHFEEALNVDLSFVDSMFKEYYIEQDLPVSGNNAIQTSRGSDHITVFSCEDCQKVFKSLAGIRAHCLTHTDLKPYKCVECDYETNSKANLHTHWRQHTGQLYTCNLCDFKSANRSHLQEHIHTHSSQKAKCDICSKLYNTQKSLINHIRKYHVDSNGTSYLSSLLVRGATTPNVAVLHRCDICSRKFKKKADRDRHSLLHQTTAEDEQMSCCQLCDYKTVRPSYMQSHARKHNLIYKCVFCKDLFFLSSITLKEHLSEIHTEELQETGEDSVFNKCIDNSLIQNEMSELEGGSTDCVAVINGIKYSELVLKMYEKIREEQGSHECNECGKFFPNVLDLECHNKTHFGDKPFSCDQCSFRTAHMNGLQQHKICKHKPDNIFFMCQEENCDYTGNSQSALAHHKKTCHTTNVHLQCPKCEFTVPSVRRLKMHLSLDHSDMNDTEVDELTGAARRVHSKFGRRLQKCPDVSCSKMFPIGSLELEKHMWQHEQTAPKIFACTLCDYTTKSKEILQVHLLKHTRFKCSHCDKTYQSKTTLALHEEIHTKPDIVEDLVCKKCSFVAQDFDGLLEHFDNTHTDILNESNEANTTKELYKCTACDSFYDSMEAISEHVSTEHGTSETEMIFMTTEDQDEDIEEQQAENTIENIAPTSEIIEENLLIKEEEVRGTEKQEMNSIKVGTQMVAFVNENGEPMNAEALQSLGDLSQYIEAAEKQVQLTAT